MTRSVEIPEAAVEAACEASEGYWGPSIPAATRVMVRDRNRRVIAAALPYLAPAEQECICPPHANPEYSTPGDWNPKCPVHQPAGDGGLREALEQTAREKIAEWYGAEWDSVDGQFYETEDGGVAGGVDEAANHAYRGAQWAAGAVRPLPTREQIAEALQDHYPTAGATVASGVTCQCGYWNGVESPGRDRPVGAQGRDGLNWHRAQVVAALFSGGEE